MVNTQPFLLSVFELFELSRQGQSACPHQTGLLRCASDAKVQPCIHKYQQKTDIHCKSATIQIQQLARNRNTSKKCNNETSSREQNFIARVKAINFKQETEIHRSDKGFQSIPSLSLRMLTTWMRTKISHGKSSLELENLVKFECDQHRITMYTSLC